MNFDYGKIAVSDRTNANDKTIIDNVIRIRLVKEYKGLSKEKFWAVQIFYVDKKYGRTYNAFYLDDYETEILRKGDMQIII